MLGVADGFATVFDLSDVGGDGGVGASERPDEDAVFVGGVSKEGEDVVVVVGDSSDRGDLDPSIIGCRVSDFFSFSSNASSALRSFSFVISVSILRSESSSLSLWASILSASRSCSPARISSSSMTSRSMVWLYFDSRSSREDSVFLC